MHHIRERQCKEGKKSVGGEAKANSRAANEGGMIGRVNYRLQQRLPENIDGDAAAATAVVVGWKEKTSTDVGSTKKKEDGIDL